MFFVPAKRNVLKDEAEVFLLINFVFYLQIEAFFILQNKI